MRAIILGMMLALLSVAGAQAHDLHGGEGDDAARYRDARHGDLSGDRDRDGGMHYGRYRPFYYFPMSDCPDEPRRYNRRTGRMEPCCGAPASSDRTVGSD